MVLMNQVRLFLQVVSRGLAFIWAISTVENSESCRAIWGQRGPSHHHPPEGLRVMGNVPAAQSGDSNDRDSPAGDSKAMGNVPAALGTAQSGEHPGVGTAQVWGQRCPCCHSQPSSAPARAARWPWPCLGTVTTATVTTGTVTTGRAAGSAILPS